MSAGKIFKAIDAPTKALIVPYQHGEQLIADLCAADTEYDLGHFYQLLQQAQQYSVNVFSQTWDELMQAEVIHEIQGMGVYYLDKGSYHDDFGVNVSSSGGLSTLSFG